MPPATEIATLTTGTEFREAAAVHMAIHGQPETVWGDFQHRHPRWSAPCATIAVTGTGIEIAPGAGGVEIGAPAAAPVPWRTGWRSAARAHR